MNLAGKINVADDAYPWLIRNFTPTGIKGLSFAALTAAIISSLASMFNSTSTLFTMDIYKKYINKGASDKQLVNTGRIVAVSALVGIPVHSGVLRIHLSRYYHRIRPWPAVEACFFSGCCLVSNHHHSTWNPVQGAASRRGIPVPCWLHLHHTRFILHHRVAHRQELHPLRAS